jgi:arylsulfatase A-like enzyme
MPTVQRELVGRGVTFENGFVTNPVCCPSRASILTGAYSHTNRVYTNSSVMGGFEGFRDKSTVATWLDSAGYSTALLGKYLNFFGRDSQPGYVPPGWDTFAAFMSSHGSYYNYRLSDGTSHGSEPADYSTDVIAERATDFIATTPVDQPLFLYFAPFGPHAPYTPAPRHLGSLEGKLPQYTASTLYARRSAMPLWMQLREQVTQADVDMVREHQTEALLSVDDAVGSIVTALQQAGRDRNTLFIFMSDNGYFWGEHQIIGKDSPYDKATQIPMVLRWDGHVAAGDRDPRIVLNVDVARTIAAATGARMDTDGQNILGPRTRPGFVLEAMNGYHERPAYCGYRTPHRMFVQWATGEQELYDYRLDPDERHNLAHRPAWREVRRDLKAKAKAACRPLPPHFHW